MCVAVHGRIESIDGEGLEATAVVAVGDAERTVSLAMTPEAAVGDWVVFHSGYALRVIDEAEAAAFGDTVEMGGVDEPAGGDPSRE